MDYHFISELTDNERVEELLAQIKWPKEIHSFQLRQTRRVYRWNDRKRKIFLLPVPVSIVTELQDGAVQPAGKVSQQTLTTIGSRILRDLLTHDLSFWITRFYTSVNSRCNLNKYTLMIYRACLLQTIHFMVALCAYFPYGKILVSKFNFSGRAAAQSFSSLDKLLTSCCVSCLKEPSTPQPGAVVLK